MVTVLSICLSVITFSAATHNKTATNGFIKNGNFGKNAVFESYSVKTEKPSERANMQISLLTSTKVTCSAFIGGTISCNARRLSTLACYLVE